MAAVHVSGMEAVKGMKTDLKPRTSANKLVSILRAEVRNLFNIDPMFENYIVEHG
jgi:hypothetical protein